jgi:hypothetical protein
MRPKPSGAPLTSHQIQPRIRGPSVHRSCRLEASGTTVAVLRRCEHHVTPSRQSDGASIVTWGSSGHLTQILHYCEFEQKLDVERLWRKRAPKRSSRSLNWSSVSTSNAPIAGLPIHRAGRTCGQPRARSQLCERAALRATRQDVPLLSAKCTGLRVDGQAQFNPVAYPFGPARACLGRLPQLVLTSNRKEPRANLVITPLRERAGARPRPLLPSLEHDERFAAATASGRAER